jgi:hypothetical protein
VFEGAYRRELIFIRIDREQWTPQPDTRAGFGPHQRAVSRGAGATIVEPDRDWIIMVHGLVQRKAMAKRFT